MTFDVRLVFKIAYLHKQMNNCSDIECQINFPWKGPVTELMKTDMDRNLTNTRGILAFEPFVQKSVSVKERRNLTKSAM